MGLIVGIVCILAGLLLFLATCFTRFGQLSFGPPGSRARIERRTAFIGPAAFAVGVIMLMNHLAK